MSHDCSGGRRPGGEFTNTEKEYILQLCRESDVNLEARGRAYTFAELASMMSKYFYPEYRGP
jgi:hypothetical protein